jgi:chaperonin GroES
LSNHLKLKTIGAHPELLAPYGNYIVVELLKPEKESAGGLALPDEVIARDRQMLARVIAVGPGQRSITTGELMPCFTYPGDLVLVLKHAPIDIKIGGHTFNVLAEGDIIGKLDEATLELLLAEAEVAEAEKQAALEAEAAAKAETEGVVEQETDEGTVTERPSGLLIVTGKS